MNLGMNLSRLARSFNTAARRNIGRNTLNLQKKNAKMAMYGHATITPPQTGCISYKNELATTKNPKLVEIEVSNVKSLSKSLKKANNIGVTMTMKAIVPIEAYFALVQASKWWSSRERRRRADAKS